MRSLHLLSKMRVAAFVALTAIVVVACNTVEETGRKQFNVLGESQERSMGLSEFEKYKKSKPIVSSGSYYSMTQRVGHRLSRVINVPNAAWEFVVFQDSTPNAFALPGGKVGVHTGLFKVVSNEAQLAAVLGHEIGHVKARHSGERLSNAALGSVLGVAAGILLEKKAGVGRGTAQAAGQGLATLRLLSFSRRQELEADRLGAIYMARAGYNPNEAVKLWERFAAYKNQAGANKTPTIFSTHPVDSKRIEELKKYMPEAMAQYNG